jgi:hypothetical protein
MMRMLLCPRRYRSPTDTDASIPPGLTSVMIAIDLALSETPT